jgi:hypothetical protein
MYEYDIVFELPRYRPGSGGIASTIELVSSIHKLYPNLKLHVRFQNSQTGIDYNSIGLPVSFSIGLPGNNFPSTDWVITYTDTPYGEVVAKLPQINSIAILMLSYGMAPEREKRNININNIKILSSTYRTKKLLEKDNIKNTWVGFGVNAHHFYQEPVIKNKKIAVLLQHSSPDKKYAMGVSICDRLYSSKYIDEVITFGASIHKDKLSKHPKALTQHYTNATVDQIRNIFSNASIFIMPSILEGLSRTPMEATLCGCPAVLCDGALEDIYFPEKNCKWALKNVEPSFLSKSIEILNNDYSFIFKSDMEQRIKSYTWDNTANNIIKALYE